MQPCKRFDNIFVTTPALDIRCPTSPPPHHWENNNLLSCILVETVLNHTNTHVDRNTFGMNTRRVQNKIACPAVAREKQDCGDVCLCVWTRGDQNKTENDHRENRHE